MYKAAGTVDRVNDVDTFAVTRSAAFRVVIESGWLIRRRVAGRRVAQASVAFA